jgi:hypothetical protein
MAATTLHRDPELFRLLILELRLHLVVQRHLISAYATSVRGIEGENDSPMASVSSDTDRSGEHEGVNDRSPSADLA